MIFANANRVVRTLLLGGSVILALFSVTPQVQAGVGMLNQGTSLYYSTLRYRTGDKYWNLQRQSLTSICQRQNATMLQGYEYGYSYYHTVFARVGLAYRDCSQANQGAAGLLATGTRKAAGVGDVWLGVRSRLNYNNTASWEGFLLIPTGYNNTSPSRLGRGALGLGLGLRFSSAVPVTLARRSSWGWKLGTRFIYFFSGKGNTLRSFAAVQYAVTTTDFVKTGDFIDFRAIESIRFARGGVQQQVFFNQAPSSMTVGDRFTLQLKYTHAFVGTGLAVNARVGRDIFGRNSPQNYRAGLGISYRWRN